MSWFYDFYSLLYPRICACCGNSLWRHEETLCDLCDHHLPKTNYQLELENPVSRIFWGRVELVTASAYLHFNKGNRAQKLIHQLKYKGRKDVGIRMGRDFGRLLKHSPFYNDVGVIIPVPLHKRKYMQRGYNQSELFAEGLARSMGVPVEARNMVRTRETSTQTRKSRFHRWENVADLFVLEDPHRLRNAHVLLVDDVITTGATLEAAAAAFREIPGVRISFAAIAATRY